MTDKEIALIQIEAYNRGYSDGYEVGIREWSDYEDDMMEMRNDEG